MIYHNQYTLTIGQYEIMEITGDRTLLCKLPIKMPKKWLDKAHKRLMVDYNKQANEDKIKELIEKDFEKIEISDRAIFLECLENMIKISSITGNVSKELNELYKKHYGKEPESKKDFERPFKEKERLITKANQYFNEEDKKDPIEIKSLLRNIEAILKTKIRDDKFYLLAGHIEDAAKLNKPKQ